MNRRIALIGASSTGKSTVFKLLERELEDFDFISESTRTVREYGFPINELGTDASQLAISSYHLQALLSKKELIVDRCYLDLLVYTEILENTSSPAFNFILKTWEYVRKEYTHFIYFPIEFSAVDDGVRSVDEEWRKEVDNLFRKYLIFYDIPYLKVTGSPKQRVQQILKYIDK